MVIMCFSLCNNTLPGAEWLIPLVRFWTFSQKEKKQNKTKPTEGPKQQIGIQQFKKKGKSQAEGTRYILKKWEWANFSGKIMCHLIGLEDNNVGKGRGWRECAEC